ncbi:MAG: hypothetical protein IIC59_04995 [Proteobacteria bacterium]|nr:hypothetical protein [Pseudomonadota bacterium]
MPSRKMPRVIWYFTMLMDIDYVRPSILSSPMKLISRWNHWPSKVRINQWDWKSHPRLRLPGGKAVCNQVT